jgi:hypothetical protein
MKNGLNLFLSQALWLLAVGGAAHGHPWLGPLALLIFALVQLSPRFRAPGDALLMWLALPVGFVVDTVMASTGLLRYASPFPDEALAPVWIVSLWMGFALTFNHSLAYVMRRWWLAVGLGALVGPFSYWLASRTWAAVHFTDSLPVVLITLGALWAVAMGLFSYYTMRLSPPPISPSNGACA